MRPDEVVVNAPSAMLQCAEQAHMLRQAGACRDSRSVS